MARPRNGQRYAKGKIVTMRNPWMSKTRRRAQASLLGAALCAVAGLGSGCPDDEKVAPTVGLEEGGYGAEGLSGALAEVRVSWVWVPERWPGL